MEVTQPEADMVMAASPQVTIAAQVPPTGDRNAGNQGPSPKYSGFDKALQKLGHVMYDPETIKRELKVQGKMDPMDAFAQNNFKDFVINVQEIKVYLAVFAAQSTATMVHTPGAYYFTNQGTAAY